MSTNSVETRERVIATVRYRVRSKIELRVLDVAEGGCMVEAKGWSIRPEERVHVKLPGLGELPAKVVWTEEQRAGLAFYEPLHGAVLDHVRQ